MNCKEKSNFIGKNGLVLVVSIFSWYNFSKFEIIWFGDKLY